MTSNSRSYSNFLKTLVRVKYLLADFVIGTAFVSYFFAALAIREKAIARATIGPGFYPMLIAVIVSALCVLLFCFDLYAFMKKRGTSEMDSGETQGRIQTKVVLLTILLIVGYIALLDVLGFILASVLYLTLQISLLSPKAPTRRTILFYGGLSAAFSVAVFYIFTEVFQLMLPAGILG